ncbi:hypothetical protein IWW42_003256 [Coemansia sp. RSA 1085]|nr:hypothetical protein IWW42_003256 [Coemansia sp. RSA 1085]
MELSEQLEALGSVLKSQIMSDLNSWEDRRRSETQSARSGKKSAKRARPQPLPEIPHDTLVELRQVQHELFTQTNEVARHIIIWAIGVLSVFVSVADMKGNCKLSDLIGLPGTKAVFQLLVMAVESSFTLQGVEGAEQAFVDAVMATTKDPRAISWILNQYGTTHSSHFLHCIHMYAISLLAQGDAAVASLESSGLGTAINDLATTHPEQHQKTMDSILDAYRQAVSSYDTDSAEEQIAEDDYRRFVLFYMLQSQSAKLYSSSAWLGDAIRFEMRTGFSRFVVHQGQKTTAKPLAESIEVLYGDHQGPSKKLSDQPLSIERVLGVFELVALVAGGSSAAEDIEMTDADGDQQWQAFIDACAQTLQRLVRREQEMVVLGHLPRTVKNMPQPIMNGLPEAVQRGGRIFNNGPISHPSTTLNDAEAACQRLFAIASAADSRTARGRQLRVLLWEAAPLLVEILAARLDSSGAAKTLVRILVDSWPLRTGHEPDVHAFMALFRSLLAISECNRGVVFQQLLNTFGARFSNNASPDQIQHAVDLLAASVDCQVQISGGTGPRIIKEPVSDLCGVLAANWRSVWFRCFGLSLEEGDKLPGEADAWTMRGMLVQALQRLMQLRPVLRKIDCITLAEHSLYELAKIQDAMLHPSFSERLHGDMSAMLGLARKLLMLCSVVVQSTSDGVERLAMERLVQLLLVLPDPSCTHTATLRVFAHLKDSVGLDNMLREPLLQDQDTRTPMQSLEAALEGRLLPATTAASRQKKPAFSDSSNLAMAEQLLWQNAIRPLPKYPRSGLRNHDRVDDAWAFARPLTTDAKQQPVSQRRPLLMLALLTLACGSQSATGTLVELLQEYYADSIPSMPLTMLDERLQSARLQLRPQEMELLQDIRQNGDLEAVLFRIARDSSAGASAAKTLVSALVAALVVFWNGALGEAASKRPRDLEFTLRVVSLVADAYAADVSAVNLCPLLPLVSGKDVSRLLLHYVWRWLLHRFPAAEDESHRIIRHIMRRHIVHTAALFKSVYPMPS